MTIAPGNLDQLLGALGLELAARDTSAHLVVIGGSALVATGITTRATRDVDVVALVVEDALHTAEPLPAEVADAAASVARNFDLPPAWLNGGPTSLLAVGSGLPEGFRQRAHQRTYGDHLTVEFAGRTDLIHLKLAALADRSEARDLSDLNALQPTADELRAAARWARTHNMPGPFDDQLAAALAQFGVADEGRLDD